MPLAGRDGSVMAQKRNIAVIGGGGFVGRHVHNCWHTMGVSTGTTLRFLLHRSRPDWLLADGIDVRSVDLESRASLREAFEGCQGLINLLRPDGTLRVGTIVERALGALPADPRIVLHTSSIDVYGDSAGELISETTEPAPRTPYAREHLQIERLFTTLQTSSVILRLGKVFGIGGRNLLRMAEQVGMEPAWKLAIRRALNGRRRMHLVAVEFVAAAICSLAVEQATSPNLVLITQDDEADNNFAFVQDRFATAFGRTVRHTRFAPASLLSMAGTMRARPVLDARRRFSGARMRSLSLRPPRPLCESIDRYAAHLAREWENGAG